MLSEEAVNQSNEHGFGCKVLFKCSKCMVETANARILWKDQRQMWMFSNSKNAILLILLSVIQNYNS